MKALNKIRRLVVVLGFLGCCFAARAQNVILVVNKSSQISEISAADLRAIYTGTKTRFSDGSHAVPVTLKGGPAHEVFLKNYVGERPDEFRAQWRKAVFTGQGAMPRAFDSESAMIDFIAATPGALGYVSHVAENDKVKPLTITK
jgi:ABC-type phosphate transport system substrate-binding protein